MYLQKVISKNFTDLEHWIIQILSSLKSCESNWIQNGPVFGVACIQKFSPQKILWGCHKSSKVMYRRIHGIQFFFLA
jgi:hypothetical protein